MALITPTLQGIVHGTNGFDCQAFPDNTDIAALQAPDGGTGVIAGGAITAQSSPNMTVQSPAYTLMVNGVVFTVAANTSISIATAGASDRKDIVVYTVGTGITTVAGTVCGTPGWVRTSSGLAPQKAAIPASSCLLGEVVVNSTTTSIAAINIVDKTAPCGAAPGTLLARAQSAPSTAGLYTVVVAATGLTALDTTNLVVTFIGPPSGAVMVRLQALVKQTAAAKSCYFGLVSTTGSPGTLAPGSIVGLANVSVATPADFGPLTIMDQLITGLTPGTSYTWYFAASCTTATDTTIIPQGSTTNTATPTGAPAMMEVWAA